MLSIQINARLDLVTVCIQMMFGILISLVIRILIGVVIIIIRKLIAELKVIDIFHQIFGSTVDGKCCLVVVELLFLCLCCNGDGFILCLIPFFCRNILTFIHVVQDLIPSADGIIAVL